VSINTNSIPPAYPVATTNTSGITDTATTTTTTTTSTVTTTPTTTATTSAAQSIEQAAVIQPKLSSKPIGQHARTLKLDWNNPSERQKYLEATGLPEVHAAVLNEDWEAAEKILNWKDIEVLWRSASSRDAGCLEQLVSLDRDQQQSAITDMAIKIVNNTSVEGAGCVHGSNLLTLALQKAAPLSFLKKLIHLTEQCAYSTLSAPDASGRTPLYIAVERGDKEQVALLLEAGADPHILCNFQGESVFCVRNSNFTNSDVSKPTLISAYRHAMHPEKLEIFSLLVEKSLANWSLQASDPVHFREKTEYKFILSLQLNEWATQNNEVAIRTIGNSFCDLKTDLFNAKDCTGTSIVYRQLKNKQPIDKGVKVTADMNPYDWPICKAANSQDVAAFFSELEILLKNDPSSIDHLLRQVIEVFVNHNTQDNIRLLVQKFPIVAEFIYSIIFYKMYDSQLPYEEFAPLVKAAWPGLTPEKKNERFQKCAFQSDEHTTLILSHADFYLGQNHEAFSPWINRALAYGNRTIVEYLSKHIDLFNKVREELPKFNEAPHIHETNSTKCMLIGILRSGGRAQFERLIIAGLNLQKFIECDPEILPLIADCNPNGMTDWIAGLNITVTGDMISLAKTKAGQLALNELIETQKTHS